MRRVTVLLTALMFALAMNGEALAKDPKPKAKGATTEADKQALKEQALEHKFNKKDSDSKGAPLIKLHVTHGKPDSSWLHEKGHKGY